MESEKKPYKKPELKKLQIPNAWGQEILGFCGAGTGVGGQGGICEMGMYPDQPGNCFGGTTDAEGGCNTGATQGF